MIILIRIKKKKRNFFSLSMYRQGVHFANEKVLQEHQLGDL